MSYIKQHLIRIIIFSLVFLFFSCSTEKDDIHAGYKYFTGVIEERSYSKSEVISIINDIAPDLNIGNSALSMLIKPFKVAAITYMTTGVDGKPIEASGIVAYPISSNSYESILSINVTTIDIEEAPSKKLIFADMFSVILGRTVVVADNLGYGITQTPIREHNFLHIQSTGIVCADMIEAGREYLHSRKIEGNNRIELAGYSSGGTGAIATTLELERRGEKSRIIKVHAGGGIYNIDSFLRDQLTDINATFSNSRFIPYIIISMNYSEQLSIKESNIYSERIMSENITNIFKTQPLSTWQPILGDKISDIINADFYSPNYNDNTDIVQLLNALNKNSLVNCTAPLTPVMLYHSRSDDYIPFSNAEEAHNKWPNSTLVEMTSEGHIYAGVEFFLRITGLWNLINK